LSDKETMIETVKGDSAQTGQPKSAAAGHLHPSEEFVTYTTDTGKRVMRFNIRTGERMPDLKVFPARRSRVSWTATGRSPWPISATAACC